MLQILKSENDLLRELNAESYEKGAWINLMDPSSEELNIVRRLVDLPLDVLTAALDEEESARMEIENEYILVLIDVPRKRDNDRYETLPLGIILVPDAIVTVCLEETDVLTCFNRMTARLFDTGKRTRFLFNMLYRSATFFLRYLRQINIRTDEIERHLRQSMKNEELFQLLEMEKSLPYARLPSGRTTWSTTKLLRLRNNAKLDTSTRSTRKTSTSSGRQSNTAGQRDCPEYTKFSGHDGRLCLHHCQQPAQGHEFLTSMTIILAIPTMFASFWGMNVGVPWLGKAGGFWAVGAISALAAGFSAFALWRRNML